MNEGESKINSAISAACLMASQSEIADCLYSGGLRSSSSLTDAVNSLTKAYPIIDSLFIYSQNSKEVLFQNEIYPLDNFFRTNFVYDLYNEAYWSELRFYNSASYRILLPTTVVSEGITKNILPVAIQKSENKKFTNMLIININLNHLISASTMQKITENSQTFIFNRYNNTIFNSNMKLVENQYPKLLSQKLTENISNTFDIRLDSEHVLVNSISNTNSLNGYTYFSVTPYKDIWKLLFSNLLLSILIGTMFIIMAVFISVTSTSKTVTPLRELFATLLKRPSDSNDNIILKIQKAAMDLYEQNSHLRETLPAAQAKYLIDFLNNTDYTTDEKVKTIINESLPFKYNYYAVVIIQISFKNILYDTFSDLEFTKIKYGLYDLIKELFSAQFDSFVLSGGKNELYIIMNNETDSRGENIDMVIENITTALSVDASYLNISIGKSKFYEGMNGLKKAHNEALTSLNTVQIPHDDIHINIKNNEIKFIFDSADELNLFNAIIGFKIDTAVSLVNNIAEKNKGADSRSKQQLYHHILNTILKVVRIKNIPYKNDKLDFEIYNAILNLPPDEMHNNIISILEYIKDYSIKNNLNTQTLNSNVSHIIEYVEKNYTNPSLSLEMVSSAFNISPSNISAMIKNNLGIGFHDYIINLRIGKAKMLLLKTDTPISTISIDCGFGSEKTFFRIFKKNVGITAGEFRKKGGA
ncbi:MAG: AraC family transcriptional regulator [Clostridia bacterium]|nr:AraC family transcriptional regulator [Clostridia bacterium]